MLLNNLIAQLQAAQAAHGNVKVITNTDMEAFFGANLDMVNIDTVSAEEVESCYDESTNVVADETVIILG